MRAPLLLLLLLASPVAAQGPAPQPNGALTPESPRAVPAPGSSRAAPELDRAFAALADAPDERGAAMAEAAIRQLWARQASAAVSLLLNRGVRNLRGREAGEALEDFDAALTLAPSLADAWHWRAQAHAQLGDAVAAATDLRECLRLEPRHFPALQILARLQEEAGDHRGALRSFEAVLAINPRLPGGGARLAELRRRAEGEAM
jgi:tetratricopeptide (TPR) repeat protein